MMRICRWNAISVNDCEDQWLKQLCPAFVHLLPWQSLLSYRAIANFRKYFRVAESPLPCGRAGRYNTELLSLKNPYKCTSEYSGLRSLGSITPKAESESETLVEENPHRAGLDHGSILGLGGWTRPRHDLDWGIDDWWQQQQYFGAGMQQQQTAGE